MSKELKVKGGAITIIPESTEGIWTIPAQIQIDNGFDESYIDIDRDDIGRLIEILQTLKH
ncbi:MAG: hypothetical protein SNI70_10805 [Rikenellaceae bacterium]